MPDRREIERLIKIVRSLADEENVLAERGEPLIELPPPPNPQPMDAQALARVSGRDGSQRPPPSLLDFDSAPGLSPLGGASADEENPEADAVGDLADEGSTTDFSSLLQDIDLGEGDDDSSLMAEDEGSFALESLEEGAGGGDEGQDGIPSDTFEMPAMPDLDDEAATTEDAGSADLPEGGDFDLASFVSGFEEDAPDQAAPDKDAFDQDAPDTEGFSAPIPAAGGAFDMGAFEPPSAASGTEEEESLFSESPNAGLPDLGQDSPGTDDWGSTGLPMPESFEMPSRDGPTKKAPDASSEIPDLPDEDLFSSFSFDGGLSPSSDAKGAEGFDLPLPGAGGLDEPLKAPETFSLGDDWEEPASMDMRVPDMSSRAPEASSWAAPSAGADEAFPESGGPKTVALDEKALDRLQDALLSYPLNLRLEIEKSIGDGALNDSQTAHIVEAMVSGLSAVEIAPILGRMLGRRIKVPKGFERRTGEALEAEQGTFWYAFKKNILPVIGWFAVGIAGLTAAVLAAWFLVYVPLRADWLYRSGLSFISRDDYVQSETLFETAWRQKKSKEWHFRYARAYRERRAWEYAERKYRQMLEARYPRDRRAALEWAEMESLQRQDYRSAAEILKKHLLEWYPKDAAGLLAFGDNALAWADDEAPGETRDGLLEQARKTYASLIRIYGRKDRYLGRMARYFVRADKLSEVEPLRDLFLLRERPDVDALTLAEMGGYLIDKGRLQGVQQLLDLGFRYEKALPEINYHFARYYLAVDLRDPAVRALDGSIAAYRALPTLSRNRLRQLLDCLNWRGREAFSRSQVLPAREFLDEGVARYEDALEKRRLAKSARFGQLYAGLGDISYSHDMNLEAAYDHYARAEEHGYVDQESLYRRGYVRYRQNRHEEALFLFYRAATGYPESQNLALALANALSARGDWAAAAGGYRELADALRRELSDVSPTELGDRPDQGRLILLEMLARNNLGVALWQLSHREGSVKRRSEALGQFTEASRLYDRISRDPDTMVRLTEFSEDNFNLPYANMDSAFHPEPGFEPLSYGAISRDLEKAPRREEHENILLYGSF